MKKYYIIYAAIGVVLLLSCGVVFLNPYHGHYAPFEEGIQMTSAGKILTFGVLALAALAAIASIVYRLYKFIQKIWLKAHNRKDDEENGAYIPGVDLSKRSFKDIPGFCRLQFRAVGEDFEKMLEEEKDKQNRE